MILKPLTAWAVLFLSSPVVLAQQAGSPPEQRVAAPGVVTGARFSETLTLPIEKGQTESLEVSLGTLSLSGGRRIEVPPLGFYVATLITGDLVTNIGGKEALRHPGDSWAVNFGETMVVQLQGKSESVLLRVFTAKVAASAQ